MLFSVCMVMLPTNISYAGLDQLLLNAVENGQWESAHQLIDDGADVNSRDIIGYSVLHHAVKHQNPDIHIIRLLLKKGADPNAAIPAFHSLHGNPDGEAYVIFAAVIRMNECMSLKQIIASPLPINLIKIIFCINIDHARQLIDFAHGLQRNSVLIKRLK